MGTAWTPRVGAVVSRRTDGPPMTVTKVAGTQVECRWFEADGHLSCHTFGLELLQEWQRGQAGKGAQ